MNAYGRCIGISGFPSLDNEGELLVLRNATGQVIHSVNYSVRWHENELKKEGGWSIEMIDPQHPGLFEPNWRSSINPKGGTPGKLNSIERTLEDRDAPALINAFMQDSSSMILQFNEALDSIAVVEKALYRLSDGREVVAADCLAPLYDRIELRTDWPLLHEKIYTITWRETTDLAGNKHTSQSTTRIGIPSVADSVDLRINEILFDPPAGGVDYVEVINVGNKIIDLSRAYLTTRGTTGSLGTVKRICIEPKYIYTGDHLVLTTDPNAVVKSFFVANPSMLLETDALPSLPDTEGSLVVLNAQGAVMDELRYSDDWHYPLLQTKAGIALERIDPQANTQDRNNWQSAASTIGYGTPTRRNSQYLIANTTGALELSSRVISPDRDGFEDVLQIRYRSGQKGERLRIRIFHSGGVAVRELANMVLNGSESVYTWDGLNDRQQRLPAGQYIVLVEAYRLDGKRSVEKRVVVLIDGS